MELGKSLRNHQGMQMLPKRSVKGYSKLSFLLQYQSIDRQDKHIEDGG